VDDLNKHEEDAGSAHMGEQGFGAGLFYIYVCLDCDSLREKLGDALACKAIRALIDAAATVAPTGKQNSFGSRAWAYYALAEKGSRQPRSLSLAFMKPVGASGEGMLANTITALETTRANLDKVYFKGEALDSRSINGISGEGDFEALKDWAGACGGA
jgi:CRISPR system Cascade subunit CasC